MVPESAVSKWFTQVWTDNACSVDLGTCTLASETCTAPNETRLIDGVPVTRACWETTRTYQCQTVVGGGNDCGKLDATPGCAFDHETCLDDPPSGDGSCKVAERVYKCPIPGSTTQPAQSTSTA